VLQKTNFIDGMEFQKKNSEKIRKIDDASLLIEK